MRIMYNSRICKMSLPYRSRHMHSDLIFNINITDYKIYRTGHDKVEVWGIDHEILYNRWCSGGYFPLCITSVVLVDTYGTRNLWWCVLVPIVSTKSVQVILKGKYPPNSDSCITFRSYNIHLVSSPVYRYP